MTEDYNEDYIKYRLDKAFETLNDAKVLVQSKSWNSCINRLYYSVYYAAIALLLKNKYNAGTHASVKSQFSLNFVKTGIISKEQGKLYSDLLDWRHKGDYGDLFDFNESQVLPLIEPVEAMLKDIEKLIKL